MKRTSKILASTSGLLAVAAFSGLVSGAVRHASASVTSLNSSTVKTAVAAKAGSSARYLDGSSSGHACKGQNSCKGQGGCSTGDQGCKGKNSCQGKGGCKTNGSL
jgi:hypothetical protein